MRDIKFGHLDWKEMSPANVRHGHKHRLSNDFDWILHRVSMCTSLRFELS
jgi:hypothetical protein